MGDTPKTKPHYAGHRQRLRKRFVNGGGGALPDYELLELALSYAIPRRDVKPLAKHLLAQFGSYEAVIAADLARLQQVKGLGENAAIALKLIEESAVRLGRQRVMDRPVLGSWSALLDYCRMSMAHNKTEQLRILFLDKKNILIADEVQQKGTIDHTPVYPREVVKRALELQASALILVHNHPSGDPTPSQPDILMTREIAGAGKKLGITIHDHLIIGRDGHTSFKSEGLL